MSEHNGFTVDVAAVHGFGTDFQHDLDVHLSAEMTQTLTVFANTPLFGTQALSDDVKQAAKNYHARLVELYEALDVLMYNGEVMARAAHVIADAYTSADALASTDVQTAMSEAGRAVNADVPPVDPKLGRPI
ncbi:hypothetical protein [Dactylosporangium sp. CA-139066]|uniref:hypothetical protein n=1 Tax=Dactylosporangium sp. CA-139066 TaxID=3239930 RepID=UPI003D95001C